MKALSALTLLCTFILIALGGFVHNTGSSLACPDWPLCFDQVFPTMEGSVAIEHSHRLLASFVGLLTLAMAIIALQQKRTDKRLSRTTAVALLLVCLQGVLGGITVLMKLSPVVSTAHLALSQIFFATLIWIFLRVRRVEFVKESDPVPAKALTGLKWALGVTFLQMLLGAAIRHGGAGVICGLGSESMIFCIDPMTSSKTLWPTLLPAQAHMLHRILGLLTGAAVIGGTMPLLKWAKARGSKPLRLLCVSTHIFWTFQVILGLMTIRFYIGVAPATLHLIGAALLWSALITLNFLARRSPTTG